MWRGHPREVPCASDTLVRRLDLVGIAIGCPVERSSTSPLSQRPESVQSLRFARATPENPYAGGDMPDHIHLLFSPLRDEVGWQRSQEHTSELQSRFDYLYRVSLETK